MQEGRVIYDPIETERIARKCWVARTKYWIDGARSIRKFDVEAKGEIETEAIDKLKQFLGDKSIEQIFNEKWRHIVCNADGTVDLFQVMKELSDYSFMLEEVPKVYSHITNNTLSKPNYFAASIIAKADDCLQEAIDRAIKEYKEENKEGQ